MVIFSKKYKHEVNHIYPVWTNSQEGWTHNTEWTNMVNGKKKNICENCSKLTWLDLIHIIFNNINNNNFPVTAYFFAILVELKYNL